MTIKIIWTLIAINTAVLIIFIVGYFIVTHDKKADYMATGYSVVFGGILLLVILLAAVPLRFSQAAFTLVWSGFFATLPLIGLLGVVLSGRRPSANTETMSEVYYNDKIQRKIANAIEQDDTVQLQKLIKGQDLNIKGNRAWGNDGLSYLQFAIRLRGNPISFPFNDEANTAAIRMLIANGSATTPALAEAADYLSAETFALLLNAGGNPNVQSYTYNYPLLFQTIGTTQRQNDIAILLVRKGADVNAKNDIGFTPVMFAANNARTSANWNDVWRVVRILLEEANADYRYTTKDGENLQNIIRKIRVDAKANNITMPHDFVSVVSWLKKHGIDTEPALKPT